MASPPPPERQQAVSMNDAVSDSQSISPSTLVPSHSAPAPADTTSAPAKSTPPVDSAPAPVDSTPAPARATPARPDYSHIPRGSVESLLESLPKPKKRTYAEISITNNIIPLYQFSWGFELVPRNMSNPPAGLRLPSIDEALEKLARVAREERICRDCGHDRDVTTGDQRQHQHQPSASHTDRTSFNSANLIPLQLRSRNDLRRTPPFQPGEREKQLPSFSEFVEATGAHTEHTPPRTPSRRNGSTTHSPREQPPFEEVAGQDPKRRRVEQRVDSMLVHPHYSHATAPLPDGPRRQSSSMEPALHSHNSSYAAGCSRSSQHHRSSLSYPPPHVQNGHQSSPGAQVYPGYRPSPGQPTARDYPTYAPPPPHSTAYDHRHSYYEPPPPAHPGYGYASPAHYGRPSYHGGHYPGYESGYPDIRFQQHLGMNPEHGRKRRGNLPKEATNMMKGWFAEHRHSPYPSEDQKMEFCERTGLTISQVSNWFINARRREPEKEKKEREARERAAREAGRDSDQDGAV
ncbi:hypothetical protein EK21DRAFT_90044 [Setomelanomma holmii]|uniref:Homeobox domain-containing protein n=1 Tax=Setomelanomma holmii TaxID=210430 RepID=A0A9P4H7M3_9PLEO|nr:hypothetical protein EK21DRAFT_90044 [Setomelanomma holmii]